MYLDQMGLPSAARGAVEGELLSLSEFIGRHRAFTLSPPSCIVTDTQAAAVAAAMFRVRSVESERVLCGGGPGCVCGRVHAPHPSPDVLDEVMEWGREVVAFLKEVGKYKHGMYARLEAGGQVGKEGLKRLKALIKFEFQVV